MFIPAHEPGGSERQGSAVALCARNQCALSFGSDGLPGRVEQGPLQHVAYRTRSIG